MNAKERMRGWRFVKVIRGLLPFYGFSCSLREPRRKILRRVTQ